MGIEQNEKADMEAKNASRLVRQQVQIEHSDGYPIIEEKLYEKSKQDWRNTRNKLEIREEPGKWREHIRKRRDEVVVNRLRAGHTWLTDNYLMNIDVRELPPGCPLCNNDTRTVKHLLLQCRRLERARQQFVNIFKGERTMKRILGNRT